MRTYVLIFFLFMTGSSFAQELTRDQIIEQRIEFIGDNFEDADIDLTTYFEELYQFFDTPINLNNATASELRQLRLLTDMQVLALVNYRERFGQMVSIYELNAVAGFDEELVEMLLPFVSVSPVVEDDFLRRNALKHGKHEIITRYERVLQEKQGYVDVPDSIKAEKPNNYYLGSPDNLYLRYRSTYKNRISWGVTTEKDAGEAMVRNDKFVGFDYYSAHLFLKDFWKFDKIALGDFQVNFGQGLTFWSGFGLGKTANISSANRYGTGLKPYTSVNESRFMRGVGVNLQRRHLDFTAFGSIRKIDANLYDVDSLNEVFQGGFSSFQITGYHRTPRELENKDAITEKLVGGEIAYKGKGLRIGFTSVYAQFSQPFDPVLTGYKQFNFQGNQLITSGINYRYYFRKMSWFGETAMSDNLKFATVNGLTWQLDPRLTLLSVYRNYDKAYQALYSTAFGETSNNRGEVGWYVGFNARIHKKVSVTTYFDQFKYTFYKWLTDDYSVGHEFFAQIDYKHTYKTSLYLRFRSKTTERNTQDEVFGAKFQVPLQKNSLRLNYTQIISGHWSMKTRFEWVNYKLDNLVSNGYLFFQDLIFKFNRIPLKIYGRYAIFDTESYDSRVYAYENDLWGVFSIPSYFYQGIRTYVMLKYDLGRKLDVWVRYDLWSYANRDEISSRLERIDGGEKSTIKIQLKIKL
jgi:hypothetical protein